MKIVTISDVHLHRPVIPDCDLLIDAGDWTGKGDYQSVKKHFEWLEELSAKEIVTIPGNHELVMEQHLPRFRDELKNFRAKLLINESVEVNGLKIYGSPVTPTFMNWAWNVERGDAIQTYWDAIPKDVDVLITHGPPYGILDITSYPNGVPKQRVGCYNLAETIKTLPNLKLHVFGHIHGCHGIYEKDGIVFANSAICDENYVPSNKPHALVYENGKITIVKQ